jgi:predicted aminopeptidase
MEPFTWCFPIVGKVEYKGFFSKKDALREIHKLQMKGLDTCLQRAIAFSTLGWLGDPLYSTILKCQPVQIIDIIIHELVHKTVYFKGETDFNEQIASLIAEKGSLMFIEERFGLDSAEYQTARDIASDDKLMAGFFQDLYDALKGLYARDLPMAEKLRLREEIFALGQQRLAVLSKQLKAGEAFESREKLNNAVVLAYRRYMTPSQGLLQQVYEAVGSNVKAFIELLLAAQKSKESPASFLAQWLETRPQPPTG